jgi:hypothetical protein
VLSAGKQAKIDYNNTKQEAAAEAAKGLSAKQPMIKM